MTATILIFLAILIIASTVLMWEARTGRFTSRTDTWNVLRGGLFFLATVVGGTLLIRSVDSALLLALAFVPVTLLSLMRFVAIGRARRGGFASLASMVLALFLGISLSLRALPEPIDEGFFLEHILYGGDGGSPESIDPGARRSVRV